MTTHTSPQMPRPQRQSTSRWAWVQAHPGKGQLRVSMEPVTMVTKPQRQDSSRARKRQAPFLSISQEPTGVGGGGEDSKAF